MGSEACRMSVMEKTIENASSEDTEVGKRPNSSGASLTMIDGKLLESLIWGTCDYIFHSNITFILAFIWVVCGGNKGLHTVLPHYLGSLYLTLSGSWL